jgi:hypothetical protein
MQIITYAQALQTIAHYFVLELSSEEGDDYTTLSLVPSSTAESNNALQALQNNNAVDLTHTFGNNIDYFAVIANTVEQAVELMRTLDNSSIAQTQLNELLADLINKQIMLLT